ncbi:MAG: class 1 isoprenoid biosynthesis enzyme [Candidatus Methanofastidiosia archaeon]
MSREEKIPLSLLARIVWMVMSHKHPSLRLDKMSPLVTSTQSLYQDKITTLKTLPHCMSYQNLVKNQYLKEKYCIFGIFMAAATSLPVLYKRVSHKELVDVVCGKASVCISAKLLDNLNDKIHAYAEALDSLVRYEHALGNGHYTPHCSCPVEKAENAAHEIATWANSAVSGDRIFTHDVNTLVQGQVASLQHKISEYPSMKEYLTNVCERSIGNVWIDVDLSTLGESDPELKKGNDYIFKSYLIYDDVQDIKEDLKTNSVNAAVILGLNQGLFTEDDIQNGCVTKSMNSMEKAGIFEDLLWLGDVVFAKGLEIITECDTWIDNNGLAAGLGMIRMFNIRRTLKRKKSLDVLTRFLADHRKLKKVKHTAPDYIQELAAYMG